MDLKAFRDNGGYLPWSNRKVSKKNKSHRCGAGIKDQFGRESQSGTQTKGAREKLGSYEMLELKLITDAPKEGMWSHI